MVQETVKKSQKERINDKYGAMCDYYANLLARCIESVRSNEILSKLDPMGQKTSATTLFIRVSARMDQTDKEKLTSEQMLNISAVKAQALKAVNS
jgi:hypothetical protein|tara:strand:- start:127 stop:411 length:285 start_codon:yes stop_codon:yes gene_type:complete